MYFKVKKKGNFLLLFYLLMDLGYDVGLKDEMLRFGQ